MLARRTIIIVSVLVTTAFAAPAAWAHGPGNHANVEVHADHSAAAVCQVLVLADALILLEAEDTLGLVSLSSADAAQIVLPPRTVTPTATASCDVVIDSLDISFPGADPRYASANLVTGPPPAVLTQSGSRPGLQWHVDVTGAGSEARVCQVVVIVGSIIMGGGAFDLGPGDAPIIDAKFTGEGTGGGGDARCRAVISSLTVDGMFLGGLGAVG